MVNMAVSCPHTCSLGSHNCYVLLLVTRGLLSPPPSPEMKSIHKIYLHSTEWYGVLKTAKKGVGLFKFHKRRKFFSFIKNKVLFGVISLCTNLPVPSTYKDLPLSFCLAKQRICKGTYLKKSFWFILAAPLSPQAE